MPLSTKLLVTAFVLAVTLLFNNCHAQKILRQDNFDSGEWWLLSGGAKIKKGKMVVTLPDKNTPQTIPLIENSDDYFVIKSSTQNFSAELTTQWVKDLGTKTNQAFGLEYFPFRFTIKPDGSVYLFTYHATIKDWQEQWSSAGSPNPAVNKGKAANKLKIELMGNIISFYINDKMIIDLKNAYPESRAKYKSMNFSVDPYFSGNQEVIIDDYIITELPAQRKPKKVLLACNQKNRNFDEIMFDGGSMNDAEILALPPENQLLDYHIIYGHCMKVNPLWIRNPEHVFGSTITFANDDFRQLSQTLPPSVANASSKFEVTLAVNPGTIEEKRRVYMQSTFNDLTRYYKAQGKNITPQDWTTKWGSLLEKPYNLTTTEGKQAMVYTFAVAAPSLIGNSGESESVFMKSTFTVVLMIQEPDNKIIQCTTVFENHKIVKKPLPEDVRDLSIFNADTEAQCLNFLSVMLASIHTSSL